MKQRMTNVLNKHGHYFKVRSKIDTSKLEGCALFDSLEELLQAAADKQGLEIDEILGTDYLFFFDEAKGEWVECCERGICSRVILKGRSIEKYLSEWCL
ncbi:hypothetical protein [Vibrio jasicida]|uniref:hypothetical protein n=1 Tax=Vibrio jasicida TaxID=766224 RepID=UPI000CE3EB98|nr:hypothetical protein [Vibrio jasicida]